MRARSILEIHLLGYITAIPLISKFFTNTFCSNLCLLFFVTKYENFLTIAYVPQSMVLHKSMKAGKEENYYYLPPLLSYSVCTVQKYNESFFFQQNCTACCCNISFCVYIKRCQYIFFLENILVIIKKTWNSHFIS